MKPRRAAASQVTTEEIGATEFKRRCLELLEVIRRTGKELVITKHGHPVARIAPIRPGGSRLWGMLRGQMVVHGDIVHMDFTDEWEASR
jgi:prevent-host-death family protein